MNISLNELKRRARGKVVVLMSRSQFSDEVRGVFSKPEEALRHVPKRDPGNRSWSIIVTRLGQKRARWWDGIPVVMKSWRKDERTNRTTKG